MTEGPRFDPTINLGHVITAVCFVASLIGWWYIADYRLSAIERQVERLSTAVVEYVRFDERIKSHDRRIEALERK